MRVTVQTRFVGIDVGKFELVLAFKDDKHPQSFANTSEGIAGLIARLGPESGPESHPLHVAIEATGGYE